MHKRIIWARGLTRSNAGTRISVSAPGTGVSSPVFKGNDMLLRSVEHFDGRTVMTVLVTVELPHDAEVTLHE